MRRSEIPDTIFIVRLMAHKLLKSPIFIFPTARNEQITFACLRSAEGVCVSETNANTLLGDAVVCFESYFNST